MRNFYFIIILFLVRTNLNAQSYTPMLDNQNEWQIISCYMDDCFKDIYYTNGDTLVNGQQHKVLDGYHYISRTFWLREEINTQKVYLTTSINEQTNEYLLYDFSMQEGDSIRMNNPITPFPEDGGFYTLDSIRQKPILGENTARHFYFSASPSNEAEETYKPIWVEGIGSLSLVTAPGGHPNYFGVGHLSCHFKNGNLNYFDDTMQDSCDSILKTINHSSHFQIQFHVQNSKGILRSETPLESLEIFSLSGEFIRKESARSQSNLDLNLGYLSKGIYFLRIKTINQQVKTIKFRMK